MGFYDDFETADEYYKASEKQERNEYEDLPDGKYQVRVEEVKIKETKKGVPYLNWKLAVIAGKYKKRILWKSHFIDKNSEYLKESMSYLKTDLAVCGLELDSLMGLEVSLPQLLDVVLEISIKNRDGDFPNVYFNRKLDASVEENSSVNEVDIPF